MNKNNLIKILLAGTLFLQLNCYQNNFLFSDNNSHEISSKKIIKRNESKAKRSKYLEQILEKPFEFQEFNELKEINPEWQLFTLSFSSYALSSMAFTDSTLKEKNSYYINRAIENTLKPDISQFYNFKSDNVIYLGHLNLMLGAYKLLTGDDKYDNMHTSITHHLSKSIKNSKFKNIESYKDLIWPADNTVALASLKIYDTAFSTNYSSTGDSWIKWIEENLLDKKTGLMESQIHPQTGEPLDGPRGCSLGWSIMFINMFDKEFAQDQYSKFKKDYFKNTFGYTGVKERLGEFKVLSEGDIDSGPIILGHGVAATGFGYGASKALEDYSTFEEINKTINFFDGGIEDEKTLHYKNYSPISDAILLFCQTTTKWDNRYINK